jgi:ribonuclease P protein component
VAPVVARPEVSHVPASNGISVRLSRPARLRKHADFEKVYRSGRRIFSAHMTVFFLRRDPGPPGQQTGPARVGFAVPRALGTAVERNRIRRRMREAVRLNRGAAGAVDVVIHPKKSALTVEFAALGEEIARAFARIQSSAKNGGAVGSK